MAQLPASLADGQLATSITDIYTAAADKAVYPSLLTLFNTNAASQTILIYVTRAGSAARKIYRAVLAQNESAWCDLKGLILSEGDKIGAETTTATAVDYTLSGVEEDV